MKSAPMEQPLRIVRKLVLQDESPGMLPGTALASNGDLLVSYNTTVDCYAGGEAYLVRSTDLGRTWGPPELVARSQRGGATHLTVGISTLSSDVILFPYIDALLEEDGGRVSDLYILKSFDNGHSWVARQPVAIEMKGPVSYGKIIELSEGTLLCPVWGVRNQGEAYRSGVLRSTDGGESWEGYSIIAYKPDIPANTGFNETTVIELPDGDLLAIIRQNNISPDRWALLYRSLSSDGGETWSPYEATNLCGTSPSLHLTPSGRLILGYRVDVRNSLGPPTHAVAISWSDDKGNTWIDQIELQDPRGFEYSRQISTPSGHHEAGYPAFVNLTNGGIFVAFHSRCDEKRFQSPFMPKGFSWYLAGNVLVELG